MDATYAQLLARIAELEKELADLREKVLTDKVSVISLEFGRLSASILTLLYNNDVVNMNDMVKKIYGAREKHLNDPKDCLKVVISRLRKRLAAYDVSIYSKPYYGYWLDQDGKETIRKFMIGET